MDGLQIAPTLRTTFAIAKKDMRLYYFKGPVIIFGLLFPLFLFLAFSIGRGLSGSMFVAPMLTMAIFFTSSSVGPIIAPWETRMKTLEKLLTTPVSVASIVLGGILAGFIFGVTVSVPAVAVAAAALSVPVEGPLPLVASIVLGAICFSSFGILLSFPATDNPSNVMMLANMVKLPLVFVSGVFVPLAEMSGPGASLTLLSPLSYLSDLVRGALGEPSANSLSLNLAALALFCLLFVGLSVILHRRTMPTRF